MRHFSCDLCGKSLTSGEDTRYVVRIEAFPAPESPLLTESDLDRDPVEEMADLLEELEQSDRDTSPMTPVCRKMEFDLCPGCYARYLADPLGREPARKLDFSSN